jgi:predicted nucleotidyltransferase
MKNTEIYYHYKGIIKAEKFILTGSTVLHLHGLLKKEPKDIDIIVVNPDQLSIEILKRLQETTNPNFNHYDGTMFQIKHEATKVDFFIVNELKEKTLELKDGIEMSLVMPIIKAKKSYSRDKDVLDLMSMAKNIYSNNELNLYVDKTRL